MRSKGMKKVNQNYEKISIEIIPLSVNDVIATSGPFNGEPDDTDDWF